MSTMKQDRYSLSAVVTADGNYTPPSATASSTGIAVAGGRYEFIVSGTPNGATAAVWFKPSGHASFMAAADVEYVDSVTDSTHKAPVVVFAKGDLFYFKITNDGASTSLALTLNRLEH